MITNIHETILNIYTEKEELIRTNTVRTYLLYPDEGKVLKNVLTGQIIEGYVGVSDKESIKNYIEIDKE